MPPITHRRNRTTVVLLLIIVILLLILGFVCYRCHRCAGSSKWPPDTLHWASWNVVFKPFANQANRATIANQVDDSLRKLLVGYGIDTTLIHPVFTHYICPCDTTLLNVDLTLINESGNPVTPSSPTKNPQPPPLGGAGGGYVEVNNFNTDVTIPEYTTTNKVPVISFPNYQLSGDTSFFQQNIAGNFVSDKVLAILDTGLDSTEFHKTINGKVYNYTGEISSLVWKDPSGRKLYNMLPGADTAQLFDDEPGLKHGSSVAYIALLAASNNNLGPNSRQPLPKLMVLKVLDSHGRGSVFTISCGMSYAIRNKATAINASLGYYGPSDPILEYYFRKADSSHIPVMVAAGNDPTAPHKIDLLCTPTINIGGGIGSLRPFYPACFSKAMPYITTVTGVNNEHPCYYQNYSDTFVNVGVDLQVRSGTNLPSNITCCSFYIPYLDSGAFVEGSSFSTPAISGSYLFTLQAGTNNPPGTPASWLDQYAKKTPQLIRYLVNGRYLTYYYQ